MASLTGSCVPVAGGELYAGRAGSGGDVVVALHGITANHTCWAPMAERLEGWSLIAPDLRGRGGSAGLPPPYGMAAHADDVARLLDDAGVERAVLLGHSMGAFVAVATAGRHPDRVSRLVLVDGGLPLDVPAGADPDLVLDAIVGPAIARLDMTFADNEAYRDFWRAHPAMGPYWSQAIQDYVDYDLAGPAGAMRSRANAVAIRADGRDLLVGELVPSALAWLGVPVTFLKAERGMLDEERALYAEADVEAWAERLPAMHWRTVAGTNHYTIVLGEPGVEAVVQAVTQSTATRQ